MEVLPFWTVVCSPVYKGNHAFFMGFAVWTAVATVIPSAAAWMWELPGAYRLAWGSAPDISLLRSWESQMPPSLSIADSRNEHWNYARAMLQRRKWNSWIFLRQRRGGKKNRFIVLLGCSTGCRTKLASLLSNVIIGIFSFSFSFSFLLLPSPLPICTARTSPLPFSPSRSQVLLLGFSPVLWRCSKARNCFPFCGLWSPGQCFLLHLKGVAPVSSCGSCEEVVKRGCGSGFSFSGVCCPVPLLYSQGIGMDRPSLATARVGGRWAWMKTGLTAGGSWPGVSGWVEAGRHWQVLSGRADEVHTTSCSIWTSHVGTATPARGRLCRGYRERQGPALGSSDQRSLPGCSFRAWASGCSLKPLVWAPVTPHRVLWGYPARVWVGTRPLCGGGLWYHSCVSV